MAESLGTLTISDLVTEVARQAGLAYYGVNGDEEAHVPINRHDLALCKMVVHNAIRRFIMDAPMTGWKWQRRILAVSLKETSTGTATSGTAVTLVDSALAADYATDYYKDCIIEIVAGTGKGENALVTGYTAASGTFTFSALSDGSTPDTTSEYVVGHRYKLPDDFSGTADGEINYGPQTNLGGSISWRDEAFIRGLWENGVTSSLSLYAVIRPFGSRQYELILWPGPYQACVIEFPYTLSFDHLELESGSATAGDATYLTAAGFIGLYADDYFNGWTITVISGTAEGGYATVTTFTTADGKFLYTALSNALTPDTTSKFMIEPAISKHPAGARFDETIRIACCAQVEQDIQKYAAQYVDTYLNVTLPQAKKLDARLAPRTLGGSKERGYGRVSKTVTFS